jgi:hypothetical protein
MREEVEKQLDLALCQEAAHARGGAAGTPTERCRLARQAPQEREQSFGSNQGAESRQTRGNGLAPLAAVAQDCRVARAPQAPAARVCVRPALEPPLSSPATKAGSGCRPPEPTAGPAMEAAHRPTLLCGDPKTWCTRPALREPDRSSRCPDLIAHRHRSRKNRDNRRTIRFGLGTPGISADEWARRPLRWMRPVRSLARWRPGR